MAQAFIRREQLAKRAEIDEILVKDLFDVILACMEEGTAVRIEGFGTFTPIVRRPRTAHSPIINGGQPTPQAGGLGIRYRIAPTLRKQWRQEGGPK